MTVKHNSSSFTSRPGYLWSSRDATECTEQTRDHEEKISAREHAEDGRGQSMRS